MSGPPLNKRVQQPYDSTQVNDQYVGPMGQIMVDQQRMEIRLHDGKRKGGWSLPNMATLKKMFVVRDAEFGGLEFPLNVRGFLTRTGDKKYQIRQLEPADGMALTNPDGEAGNPKIGLPERLKPRLIGIPDANGALNTGYYVILKGAASNLPGVWLTTSNVALEVIAHENGANPTILQIARSLEVASVAVYTRRLIAGAWSAWAT